MSHLYERAADDLRGNPGQWAAYESTGHTVLLAGPGSGKTKTLTVKLARILAEDVVPPRGVACLTFSNQCVRELERRMDAIGVTVSEKMFLGTVHSFCLNQVLRPFAALAGRPLPHPVVVASQPQRKEGVERALTDAGLDPRSGTSFDKYRRLHIDRRTAGWREPDPQMANAVEAYERALETRGLLDFDGMVQNGYEIIRDHTWVRKALLAKFPVLAIDEYQDLGGALHQIVLELCFHGGMRLFAVGDPDQSIYGFTGAQPELLRHLADRPEVQDLALRINYRCGRRIMQAAQIAIDDPRDYEAHRVDEGLVDYYPCDGGLKGQAQAVCQDLIPGLIADGRYGLGDIAVLYPAEYHGGEVETAAREQGWMTIRIDGGSAYSRTPLAKWLEACAVWCAGGWRSGAVQMRHLLGQLRRLFPRASGDPDLADLRAMVVRFLLSHRDPVQPLADWLTEYGRDVLGHAMSVWAEDRDDQEQFEVMSKEAGAGRWAGFTVQSLADQRGTPEHLNLITLHSAKGLEFPVVVIVGLDEGSLPRWAGNSPPSRGAIAEARRLFYVGVTRAKNEIYLVCPRQAPTRGERRKYDRSRFVDELIDRLITVAPD